MTHHNRYKVKSFILLKVPLFIRDETGFNCALCRYLYFVCGLL